MMFKILLFCGCITITIIGAYAFDVEPNDENSANDYLISKWRQWFRIMDIQHMHQYSHKDVEVDWTSFATVNHLEVDNKQAIETFHKLENESVFYGKPGPISEQEFIDMQNEHFKKSKEDYIANKRHYFTTALNTLYPGFEGLTEGEFVNWLKGFKHNNVALNKQFFHFYNVVDGKVSLSDIIDSWVQFATSEDSSKPDIVKAGLDLGI